MIGEFASGKIASTIGAGRHGARRATDGDSTRSPRSHLNVTGPSHCAQSWRRGGAPPFRPCPRMLSSDMRRSKDRKAGCPTGPTPHRKATSPAVATTSVRAATPVATGAEVDRALFELVGGLVA